MTHSSVQLLSKEQIRQYHEEGFLLVKGIFNQDQVKEIVAGLEDIASRRSEYPKAKFVFENIPEAEREQMSPLAYVRKIGQLQEEPWAVTLFGEGSKPKRMCSELIGIERLLTMGLFSFTKPANHGSSTPWHQDQALWQFFAPKTLSCWVAIDECTEENGYLQFYREGHKHGMFKHVFPEGAPHLFIQKEELDPSRIVPVPMEPGDGVFFSGMIPHFSEPNRSSKRRIGMPAVYGTQDDFTHAYHNSQWLSMRKQYNLLDQISEEFVTSRVKSFGH